MEKRDALLTNKLIQQSVKIHDRVLAKVDIKKVFNSEKTKLRLFKSVILSGLNYYSIEWFKFI